MDLVSTLLEEAETIVDDKATISAMVVKDLIDKNFKMAILLAPLISNKLRYNFL